MGVVLCQTSDNFNKNQYEINVENSNRLASISNDKLTVILLLFILQKELHVRGLFLKIRF